MLKSKLKNNTRQMQKMQKIMNKLKKFQAAKDIVTVRDMGLLVSIAEKMGRMGKLCGNAQILQRKIWGSPNFPHHKTW